MNCPDRLNFTTLDEVAECWDGVDKATRRELWSHIENDPRDASDDWEPAGWNEYSPNNIEKAWSRLPKELQAELVKIAELNPL